MKNKSVLIILLSLLFSNTIVWFVVTDFSQPQLLEVTFFDVGQGDAIFIETPKGHQILIDGGPDSKIMEKLAIEMPFYDRTIDLIILTHPEQDHIGGLIEVLKNYEVENILWTGVQRNTAEFQEWERLIKEERAEIKMARFGQRIKSGKVILRILFPFENLEGKEVKNTNNTSVISKLTFGENSFLFTGDVYKSIEKEILEQGIDIESDILKISHHGSKTSSDEEFIKNVFPKIAVIQCGQDNSYGHPHPETLEVLKNYDITVLRTDLDGDIKIVSDGNDFTINKNIQ